MSYRVHILLTALVLIADCTRLMAGERAVVLGTDDRTGADVTIALGKEHPFVTWSQKEVELFHEANPASLTAWYADPHSGPENPDYFRRIHGILPYKSNYDAICNYVWYRNKYWNDFGCVYAPGYRGMMMVYPTRDNVLDTLAWEGLREGLDDLRYVTKLKLVAREALRSDNAEVKLLGRKALGLIAYFDPRRGDMDQLRYETIECILQLGEAMKGAQQ